MPNSHIDEVKRPYKVAYEPNTVLNIASTQKTIILRRGSGGYYFLLRKRIYQ